MITNSSPPSRNDFISNALEATIRIVVLAVLVLWCFQIVRPFIIPVVWGIIIAIAVNPIYQHVTVWSGGRNRLSAFLLTVGMLLFLGVPSLYLTQTLVEKLYMLARDFQGGIIAIPPPPENIKSWPFIGEMLSNFLSVASVNLKAALEPFEPQIKTVGIWLLASAASVGLTILQFVLAFIISGILLAYAKGGHRVMHGIARRLAGDRGSEFANLAEATVHSVARGVVGVAVLQSVLAGLGFLVAGVPAAGLWAVLCLILAVAQIGIGPVIIPVVVYVFATSDTLTATLFLIWAVFVGILDNLLRPLLLGRGVDVPMAVIFLGSIGGLLLSGIIGLFIGSVILALGYKLFQAWLGADQEIAEEGEIQQQV
jgi:predicted PurR-regulated permease PerM